MTFNVATIFFGVIPTYGVLPYAMIVACNSTEVSGSTTTYVICNKSSSNLVNAAKKGKSDLKSPRSDNSNDIWFAKAILLALSADFI